ncbi:MAG: hypothetical protein GX060_01375 [Firmicutes bacterium]|nr:hypothetical protein [Bacillota bacterium]
MLFGLTSLQLTGLLQMAVGIGATLLTQNEAVKTVSYLLILVGTYTFFTATREKYEPPEETAETTDKPKAKAKRKKRKK